MLPYTKDLDLETKEKVEIAILEDCLERSRRIANQYLYRYQFQEYIRWLDCWLDNPKTRSEAFYK